MKILRLKDDIVTLYQLTSFIQDNDIEPGQGIGISWKLGKRRKLRSYRLDDFDSGYCEQCFNSYEEITLVKGDKSLTIDNHLGKSSFSIRDL